MRPGFLIILLVIILSEFYFIQAARTSIQDLSQTKRTIANYLIYGFLVIDIALIAVSMAYPPPNWNNFFRMALSVVFILMICKVFCLIFLLPEDLVRGVRYLIAKFKTPAVAEAQEVSNKISRAKFLSQTALVFTVIPFAGFVYGIVKGAYKYRVHNVKVPSKNLPPAFHGYKIVQVSDIHTGSFMDNTALHKAFDIVMEQKADLILFTGDLVNNEAKETYGFEEVYKKLKAPHGVYSVLGNHDYGDYVQWETTEAKKSNLEELKNVHKNAGWKLMMNEHVALEKDGQKIALLGIENWGGNMHFPKYGKMQDAHKGTEEYPFKILMSHDPSHWEKQVQTEYKDVDLTLSGHTHGMQFGIEIPGIKWSPVQYIYKQWAGLYKKDNQYLYVNRGLGFLGYPGRLGIWPEITVIELQKA